MVSRSSEPPLIMLKPMDKWSMIMNQTLIRLIGMLDEDKKSLLV